MALHEKVGNGIAIQAAVRWSWSLQRQIARLHEAESAAVKAQADSEASSTYSHTHKQAFLELTTEVHLILVAAHHLATALDLLGLSSIASIDVEVVTLLRNIQEHWDDTQGRSRSAFLDRFPNGSPSAINWGAGGSKIAGVPVDGIEAWARTAYEKLTAAP